MTLLQQFLQNSANRQVLRSICHGIEREGLRITPAARLAQTAHPEALGKALTHPYITTDYSEALLEFITPVYSRIDDTLSFLEQLHAYTCQNMSEEYLWAGSMPAYLEGDKNIPIARYGNSNIGQMKHVYREGLAHRYGKPMQTIAGIHYNFSMPTEFWDLLPKSESDTEHEHQSAGYLVLIRNFRRYSWLLMYLFGASPVISKSFLAENDGSKSKHGLETFDEDTLYSPYATSLRMSDLGYTNNAQSSLNICYNTLDNYVESLSGAIKTPYKPYEAIGLKKDGEYVQLNTNLLQIENEYYSTIRPKRIARSGEKPITALRNHGVEYIEVRCLDINPFEPLGLNDTDAHFQDVFLLYCALHSHDVIDENECNEVGQNFNQVVNEGRRPGLTLRRKQQEISLKQWGSELLSDMLPVAQMLDQANETDQFSRSLKAQQKKVDNPDITPSAQVLAAMKDRNVGYIELILSLSQDHSEYFRQISLGAERETYFQQVAERSRTDQQARESADLKEFDQFLKEYFAAD
ncbi:glutamate--cysteine ligase [Endozoicomonas sp. (ex Bugula neritina AB1)]|nr:glutamate--cysteine ligase [Endozoicomonas sp. (ex Bugula neritina AB1)]